MAPAASPTTDPQGSTPASSARIGPHPSYVEVARQYQLESSIRRALANLNVSDAKDDTFRLQGVAYIDQVRRTLNLPIRTFFTAAIYYHKFRLKHAENEYNWEAAAAAALLVACKIEDTLKKGREVLAAHYNSKVGVGEQLSSDDPRFEHQYKLILGLERMMLESASFDFRFRHPHDLMIKLAKFSNYKRKPEGDTMWKVSLDLYRTYAPLKQMCNTMAIACVELGVRLHGMDASNVVDNGHCSYSKMSTCRADIMETLLDLLDLYTHHRLNTEAGPDWPLETFINIRITLNDEASAAKIPRYTLYASEMDGSTSKDSNGTGTRNGVDSTSPSGPRTPITPGPSSPGTSQLPKSAIGIRGQSGTVRYMLDPKRAQEEKKAVDKYWVVEEEEYYEEVPIEPEVRDRAPDRERDRERERERPREPFGDRERDWERERDRDRDRERERVRDRDWDSRRVR